MGLADAALITMYIKYFSIFKNQVQKIPSNFSRNVCKKVSVSEREGIGKIEKSENLSLQHKVPAIEIRMFDLFDKLI